MNSVGSTSEQHWLTEPARFEQHWLTELARFEQHRLTCLASRLCSARHPTFTASRSVRICTGSLNRLTLRSTGSLAELLASNILLSLHQEA